MRLSRQRICQNAEQKCTANISSVSERGCFTRKKVPVHFQACFCTYVFIYEAFIPDSMYGTIGLCSIVSRCTGEGCFCEKHKLFV